MKAIRRRWRRDQESRFGWPMWGSKCTSSKPSWRWIEVWRSQRRVRGFVFFAAERGYLHGNTVDEEKVKAAIEAAWSLPQESLFRKWDSAEQADQTTNMGDTEPNSEDEDYWVANYSDMSFNDNGDHMATRWVFDLPVPMVPISNSVISLLIRRGRWGMFGSRWRLPMGVDPVSVKSPSSEIHCINNLHSPERPFVFIDR